MKQYTYILLALVLLACTSCSEQAPLSDTPTGYLSIDRINLTCDNEVVPINTRAVDAGLKLEIWQGEKRIRSYEPGATELAKRIVLPVGDFLLKAYTPDQKDAANQEVGHPVYIKEEAFTIVNEDITTITLTVPQINVGVSALFSDEIKANFTNYHVKVYSSSGREVQIDGNATGFFYFMIPENGMLHYTLTATNADNEELTSDERILTELKAGTYQVNVGLSN